MVNKMYFLPTSAIFIGYFILTFGYTIKNRKTKIENHLFMNEILIALLFLIAGVLYPFIYSFHSPHLSQTLLNYLWLFTSICYLIEMGFLVMTLIYNAIISKKNPEIMAERDYSKFCEKFNNNWKDDLKSELGRKLLHLFTCFVIFFFWTLGTILNNLGILSQWGLDNYSFSFWLIITIGYGFVIMFQIADLTRLNKFYMIPKWAKRWYMDMKQCELYTFVASTPLVLSFTPFLFAPFPIFAAVALITTGADAVACIIGKKYGKHSLKTNSEKTVEGFIAGGLTTFVIVLIVSLLYHPWMPVSIEKILLMSFIASLLFLLIDAFTKNISDNILNPILTGFGMWIIFLF
ncbi:MAG: phosphatidate cytidylyltransferase [Promethearchaeota archaeon]|nr:MAG: phosphatidate cytidylyltransferase [Candidatus Lokiarchaeota archaeon]